MVRSFLAILLLLALAPPLPAQTITRPIETSSEGVVVIRFRSGGHVEPRGKGLAVVDVAGEPVPYRLLANDPAGETWLAVNTAGQAAPLALCYSDKPLPAP